MTDKLASKVALVTGGSSGIGLGIVQRFADEGARVFITAAIVPTGSGCRRDRRRRRGDPSR